MNVIEIIEKYLTDNGFDGLRGDECGCEIANLVPCGLESYDDCEAAYKVPCDPDNCIYDGDCGWHMVTKKPEKAYDAP